MMYFSIVFLCTAGLFLALLEDRFRFWVTVIAVAGAYLLSLGAAAVLRGMSKDPVLAEQLPCAGGCLVFFLVSLFVFVNNPLQKAFLAFLCLCDFTFLSFFIPLLLGTLSDSPSGGSAGFLSVLAYCLFSLLMGLCLYRPFRHFSDRGISGFLWGMCLLLAVLYVLCLGKLDFLFRTNIPAARLLAATLLYCAMILAFRSLYQAGRFRERTAAAAVRKKLFSMKAGDYAALLANIREVQATQRAGQYALDTVNVMLADDCADKIPGYIASVKSSAASNPMLERYHEDPYLNAVIASKATLAAQCGVAFQCNAVFGGARIDTLELCVMMDEMLTRACRDAAEFPGEKRVRFTAFPAERSLRLETVYSGTLARKEKFDLRGKQFSDVKAWLFGDPSQQEDELRGLENTGDIVARHSGKLTVSGTEGEVILQASLRF